MKSIQPVPKTSIFMNMLLQIQVSMLYQSIQTKKAAISQKRGEKQIILPWGRFSFISQQYCGSGLVREFTNWSA